MNAKELREMTKEELIAKIEKLEEEIFNMRFQNKMGQLSNPVKLRLVRKDIARAKTILVEKA